MFCDFGSHQQQSRYTNTKRALFTLASRAGPRTASNCAPSSKSVPSTYAFLVIFLTLFYQPGDRILTVNGQDVTIVSHADLVALIKTAGSKLRMTVRDLTLVHSDQCQHRTFNVFAAQNLLRSHRTPFLLFLAQEEIASLKSEGDGKGAASPASAAAGGGDRKPASLATASRGATKVPLTKMEPGWTTVKLAKSPAGLGCNVSRVAQRHLFRVVAAGGAADKAGIKAGDEIIMVITFAGTGNIVCVSVPASV